MILHLLLLSNHFISGNPGAIHYDWQHYIPIIEKKPGALLNGAPFTELPISLLQLQTALRRRERQQADQIMAKVLNLVPTHGLEAVLVAAELVFESRVLSTEHGAPETD